MSTRTALRPHTVFNAVDMASNQTSEVTVLQSLSGVSYTLSWTGTSPVGTLAVQVSNDYAKSADNNTVVNQGTWVAIPLVDNTGTVVTSYAVSGNTGSLFVNVVIQAYAIRLVYTAGSGSGTLTGTVAGKVQ